MEEQKIEEFQRQRINSCEGETQHNPKSYVAPEEAARLHSRFSSGVSWFYWIAALSLINTLSYMFEWDWGFFGGLGVTQLIDAIAYDIQGIAIFIGLIINIIIACVFFGFGFLARRGNKGAVITGMIVYILDAALFILFEDWFSLVFHAIALIQIFNGLRALKILKEY